MSHVPRGSREATPAGMKHGLVMKKVRAVGPRDHMRNLRNKN